MREVYSLLTSPIWLNSFFLRPGVNLATDLQYQQMLEAYRQRITRGQIGKSESTQIDSPLERVSNEPLTTDQVANKGEKSDGDVA